MHARELIPPALHELARSQCNVVTTAQAEATGLTRNVILRMRSSGVLTSMVRGLYAVGPTAWQSWAWGGVLLGGPDAVIGGRAAAHLHGFADAPGRIDVWTTTRRLDRGPYAFHLGLRPGVGRPLRLSFDETVLDLASMASDSDGLVSALTKGVASRRTTVARLHKTAEAALNLCNREAVLSMLTELHDAAKIESALEYRYLTDVERRHGLPAAKRQVTLVRRQRIDVLYEEFGVIVELDGRLGHEGDGRFRDWRRDNAHATQGLMTLRFGWDDVRNRPCEVAAAVASVLRSRGWVGGIRLCGLCSLAG